MRSRDKDKAVMRSNDHTGSAVECMKSSPDSQGNGWIAFPVIKYWYAEASIVRRTKDPL